VHIKCILLTAGFMLHFAGTCLHAQDIALDRPEVVKRLNAAILRVNRSYSRTLISAERIRHELNLEIKSPSEVQHCDLKISATNGEAELSKVADQLLSEVRWCEATERATLEMMARYELKRVKSSDFGKDIPNPNPRGVKPISGSKALSWVRYIEHLAFMAEQHAQLVEVSSEQAVSIADGRKLGNKHESDGK